MLDVFIPGRPKPKSRPRFNRRTGRVYTPTATLKAETELAEAIKAQATYTMLRGPVAVELEFFFKATERNSEFDYHICRPDLDNLVKLVLDACNKAGVWPDDCTVAVLHASKETVFEAAEAGTHIVVTPADELS